MCACPNVRLAKAQAHHQPGSGYPETIEGARYVKRRPRVLALLLVKPAWGLGGGIRRCWRSSARKYFLWGRVRLRASVFFAARNRHCHRADRPAGFRAKAKAHAGDDRDSVSDRWCVLHGFGVATSFVVALIVLGLAHTGGSILWVFSTVLLQRGVEDNFRGRVFAADWLAYAYNGSVKLCDRRTADRFGFSPRAVAVGIGAFSLLPGVAWFVTQRWWDRDRDARTEELIPGVLTDN